MDGTSPPSRAYCTQQTEGLTLGMTLRAIHTDRGDRARCRPPKSGDSKSSVTTHSPTENCPKKRLASPRTQRSRPQTSSSAADTLSQKQAFIEQLGRGDIETGIHERAIVLGGNSPAVDVMLSEHRNLAAAKRFCRSAKAVTGVIPDRVTTDGHDSTRCRRIALVARQPS